MPEPRTKVAAGVTILALGALGGVAVSHPQAPMRATQLQAASKHPPKQAPTPATLGEGDRFSEAADD
jgi:hypothetical protein